jgi:sigma-E factor negative regulatory protein RseC
MSNKITHSGIVKSIADGCIKVQIVQTSACAACKVASHCNASESKVKIVDVFTRDTNIYQIGQEVTVWASKDVANRALLLGFGAPFLLLICVLMIALKFFGDEGLAALAALASLVPYYLALWVMKDRIQQQISFNIEK